MGTDLVNKYKKNGEWQMDLSIVLPAYLEAENLNYILPQLHRCLNKIGIEYEILVIDTMKALDSTKEVCVKWEARYVNRRGGNLYGDAIRTGIAESQGKYIVIMDSDGSHSPEVIPAFLSQMEEGPYDLIIGSRYCEGGNSHNGIILKSMSRILNVTYRIIFGLKVKDVSDSFRMYKAKQLKSIKLECDNFDVVEEILIRLSMKYQGLKIKEIPIYFEKRNHGESKRDLVKFIMSYIKTIYRLLKIKEQEKRNMDSKMRKA